MKPSLSYSFKPMQESDLHLLFQWVNEPHVKKWWDSEESWEKFRLRYSKNIRSNDSFPYIVFFQETPIGYINYWTTEDDPDFKNLFPKGSVGTDQFIGVAEMVGHGHGSKFVEAFTDWLLENPEIPVVMTDPDIENTLAIRCYQKAGFQVVKEMESVEGTILLMEKRK